MSQEVLPPGYEALLRSMKDRLRDAQRRAMFTVNRELLMLYWHIGQDILVSQRQQRWGAKVIDRLAKDMQQEFPDMKGFSTRNFKYMRAFAEAYPDEAFVQTVLAQISWYHNVTLLDRVKDPTERLWYIEQAAQHGWSRNVMVHQIESQLYQRQGQAVTNFAQTLPPAQSDLAREILKDPYLFEFLDLGPEAQERDLERALLTHVREFLLELGKGFALVGSQYRLEVGDQDFYVDLLFYRNYSGRLTKGRGAPCKA